MNAMTFVPRGVIPACLMPFDADLNVDEAAWEAHLADIASVDGVSGIAGNGHAPDVHALTAAEQECAVVKAYEVLGTGNVPVIVGIYGESSREAARMAAFSQNEGAEGLLVFPPTFMASGGICDPR